MAPVLYSPIWISIFFCIASVLALLYRYIHLVKHAHIEEYTQKEELGVIEEEPADMESGEVYELFKMAKQGGKLTQVSQ